MEWPASMRGDAKPAENSCSSRPVPCRPIGVASSHRTSRRIGARPELSKSRWMQAADGFYVGIGDVRTWGRLSRLQVEPQKIGNIKCKCDCERSRAQKQRPSQRKKILPYASGRFVQGPRVEHMQGALGSCGEPQDYMKARKIQVVT